MSAQKRVKYQGLDWVFTNSSACATEHALFIKKKIVIALYNEFTIDLTVEAK